MDAEVGEIASELRMAGPIVRDVLLLFPLRLAWTLTEPEMSAFATPGEVKVTNPLGDAVQVAEVVTLREVPSE